MKKLRAWFSTHTARYTLFGVFFGFCFPIMSTLFDILMQGMSVSLDSIVRVQAAQPLHWVIDSAPVFLGLFASFAGKRQDRLTGIMVQLEQTVAERTAELVAANRELRAENADRRQAEAELWQQKQYFEALVQNSPVAIVVLDLEHHIVSCNPAFEKLFGYSQAEAIGQNLDDMVATENARAEAVHYTEQVTHGEVVHSTTQRRRKDGTLVDVELFGVPVIVAGEHIGILALYHDISELERARREAEAADQAKSEFLANMSHEIRTPLNAVIGMTGLLLDTSLSDTQRDYVETVRSSGDALLEIINDILDFSKIEAGKMELEKQPFDLRDCIEGSLDLLAPKASEKGLEMAYMIGDTPGMLVGDVTRVRQILVNLLSNAVKFTDSGEVVVSVTAQPLGEQRFEVEFSVRDTGVGIPPERMDRLFRSFSQVDASTTRRYGGTGLGLAISKHLSEMMGGRMWVESKVGVGSTFHFSIVADAAPIEKRINLRHIQPQLDDQRVLIVDDNETNRRILTYHTHSWGMLPRSAASGPEALEWIRRGDRFDVAILDMQMPGMDGLTLATEIRKHRDAEALPLVMLTSLGHRGGDTQRVEFAAYLTKPVKPSQLYNVLVGIFERRPIRIREPAKRPDIDSQMGQRHPLRILLAEDNVVNQKVALRILEHIGYRADMAANGLEVLEALERQSYDVVLMDVQMPEMDGLEATRHIRERGPVERQPRIIALTAHALSGDRERYLAAGMDDYISKPVRVEELVEILERCQPLIRDWRLEIGDSEPYLGSQNKQSEIKSQESLVSQARQPSPRSPIDPTVLDRYRAMMGDDAREFVAELIGIFLEDTPGLIVNMREAVVRGDADGLRRSAHTLKGSSASVGAMGLSALCQELQAMAEAEALEGALQKVSQVEAEYERVKVALETTLDQQGGQE